jgi:hypothetical protein
MSFLSWIRSSFAAWRRPAIADARGGGAGDPGAPGVWVGTINPAYVHA